MDATRSAKKDGNSPTDEFNYYQDLDNRIDSLMEELRAVRNVRSRPAGEQESAPVSAQPPKDE